MNVKKHGWVLQDKDDKFVTEDSGTSECVNDAEVHTTRIYARDYKLNTDVVRKVELNTQGKAVKIIPGR